MALSNSPHRRLLDGTDEDPLSTVANLFDASMVLTVALLVALASRWQAPETAADSPQPQNSQPLPRVRPGESLLTGEGQRLGTAYQLKTGEIVYVP